MHRNGPSSENGTTGDAVKQPLVVAGRVVDEVSNDPIGQAAVTIAGRPESYITEDNGNFRIELDRSAAISHRVRIQVSKNSYAIWDRSIDVPGENLIVQWRRLP
jgi:hypothetical protein